MKTRTIKIQDPVPIAGTNSSGYDVSKAGSADN